MGEHSGAHFYTIGQRHLGIMNNELGIRGQNHRKPVYIAEKDVKENALLVAEENDPALYRNEINLSQVNFINPELRIRNKELRIAVMIRTRYRQPLFSALFIIHNSLFRLVFDKPQKFIASGQSAVFYEGNPSLRSGRRSSRLRMLGGGVID